MQRELPVTNDSFLVVQLLRLPHPSAVIHGGQEGPKADMPMPSSLPLFPRCMVPESRDVILSTEEEKALWQQCFMAAPARRREFEPSFPKVARKDQCLIPIPCHEITEAEGSIAQLREHKERMAPGICVKAFQASQQASTICSYPS